MQSRLIALIWAVAGLLPRRSDASREQRRQYQEDRRRAAGTPTRAETNEAARKEPAVVAVEVVVPLAEQHPLYARAIEALMIQRAAHPFGTLLVFPEEWIAEDELQDAVVGLLEKRRDWLAEARRIAREQRRVLRFELEFDDGTRHAIPLVGED